MSATTFASKSSNTYELNITDSENDDYAAEIEENALLIQIACESFFGSLSKTMNHCPIEFKVISKELERNMHRKYPQHSVKLCIASFIFLRYFVAGVTVPESFGIVKDRPAPQMRRRLILISKVLSNLSTNVKFGDKEDYMTVMNDYLESKQPQVEKYLNFLCNVFFFPFFLFLFFMQHQLIVLCTHKSFLSFFFFFCLDKRNKH